MITKRKNKNNGFEKDLAKSLAQVFSKNTDKIKEDKTGSNRNKKRNDLETFSGNYYKELADIQTILQEMLNEKKTKVTKRQTKVPTKQNIDKSSDSGSDPQCSKQVLEIYKRNTITKPTLNNDKEHSKIESKTITKRNVESKTSPKFKPKIIKNREQKSKHVMVKKVLSERSIVFDSDIPLKGFWNRSKTSVRLIKKLSVRLKSESLSNLLKKEVRNRDSLNNSKQSEDVVVRIFNDLQKEENPETELLAVGKESSKEVENHCTEYENIENLIKDTRPICNVEVNTKHSQIDQSDLSKELNVIKSESAGISSNFVNRIRSSRELLEPEPSTGPSSMTIKDISDMVYSAAVVFERLPVALKQSRLADLSPPESMLTAVSVLELITKSISSVNVDISNKTVSS